METNIETNMDSPKGQVPLVAIALDVIGVLDIAAGVILLLKALTTWAPVANLVYVGAEERAAALVLALWGVGALASSIGVAGFSTIIKILARIEKGRAA